MAWKEDTKPWDTSKRRIYDTLKIPDKTSEGIIIFLDEPKQIKTAFGDSFSANVGYLGGNAIKEVYVKKGAPKNKEPATVGEIYGIWMPKTLVQALVNIYPDEDDDIVGKVVKVTRAFVQPGGRSPYLGYVAEEAEDYNEALVASIVERFNEVPSEEVPEEKRVEVGNQDLEIGYQLLQSPIEALGEMSYTQIDSFIAKRKESGFIKTTVSANDLANFCVSKSPDKYKVIVDGDSRSLKLL